MTKQIATELKLIVHRLVTHYHPESIILFGSLSSRSSDEWSDIDLALIKKTRRRFLDRLKDAFLIARPKEALDILVYTPEEVSEMESSGNKFWTHEIKEKGRILYERS